MGGENWGYWFLGLSREKLPSRRKGAVFGRVGAAAGNIVSNADSCRREIANALSKDTTFLKVTVE